MECRRCGKCCAPYFSLYVNERDEERWEREGRKDLLERLDWERNRIVWLGDYPVNLETGETPKKCVYITRLAGGKYGCSIHETKPEICSKYLPGSSELCVYYHKPMPYIIGLDLHGTLLEPGEIIRDDVVPDLMREMQKVRERALLYLCTGNDLSFVDKKVPAGIRELLDGYVLETGCSMSADKKSEKVLTTMQERRDIKDLESLLKSQGFTEVNYFAHRLTSIAMFTDDPPGFFKKVKGFIDTTGFGRAVDVIYSSVAVDVIPKGYNKFRGLHAAAEGKKTIGIADSVNDLPLLLEADYSFAPRNLAPEAERILAHTPDKSGRMKKIQPLDQAKAMDEGKILVAEAGETRGVVQILGFLARNLPPHPADE